MIGLGEAVSNHSAGGTGAGRPLLLFPRALEIRRIALMTFAESHDGFKLVGGDLGLCIVESTLPDVVHFCPIASDQ